MPLVKRTNPEIRKGGGRVNARKLASVSERAIARFAREDDSATSRLGEPRYVPPCPNVRALRERLGLSQAEFARRYLLSVRTIQQWEQEKREPSEAARVLLFAIARDPGAVARLLSS
ncbi:MAG TPA: helix-turn-helix domain-containing protein [Candidatus Binatia bacterium]|nr:helix-turn-helix domain-containing protein [Candidatus Binatia bacterium]